MEKINWLRVVLGGVVAGFVLILLTGLSTVLFLGQQMLRTAVQALRPSSSGFAVPVFFVGVFLSLGILMVLAYAAIRPRFGSGMKTAAIAGLAVWVSAVWVTMTGFALESLAMGRPYSLPAGPILPCIYLALIVASTIVGSTVYKEERA